MKETTSYFDKNGNVYIIYIAFGSPLLLSIPAILKLPSQLFAWGNIMITLSMAFIILSLGGLNNMNRMGNIVKTGFPLILFFLIYLAHMIYDLYIVGVETTTYDNKFSYFLYVFCVTLIPTIAIPFLNNLDFDKILRYGYLILLLTLIASIWYNMKVREVQSDGLRSGGSEVMGPLTYGHYGVSFALLSIFRFMNDKRVFIKILYILGIGLGLFVMYLASSRGPLVALFACLFFIFLTQFGFMKGLVFLFLSVIPFVIFWQPILDFLSMFNSSFIDRILFAVEYGDSSGRDVIYNQAIKQFLKSPIIGDSFLISEGEYAGFYPHNLFLEALMATGIIGTVFFLIWLLKTLSRSYLIAKLLKNYGWISMLFIQYLVFGLSSKSFYTNYLFWFFGFLVLNFYQYKLQLNNK